MRFEIRLFGLIALAAATMASPPAEARLTKITVLRTETVDLPAFGATGPYEKISGTYEGELDPANPRDAVIADLALAPRVGGKVLYSSTFYILRPLDLGKSQAKMLYLFGNRGMKLEMALNDAHNANDPTTAEDFGNGWMNRRGYILAWSGWDGSAPAGPNMLDIQLPVAVNPDGSAITGMVATEAMAFTASQTAIALPYPADSVDPANGALTVREREADPKVPVAGWRYVDDRHVTLPRPLKMRAVYEFVYRARNPSVMGVGHAATRDFIAFLRFREKDDAGAPNPVWMKGGIREVLSYGRSQGGRVQRDFLYWGFNEDEPGAHKRIIDGMAPYATGAGLMWMNYRFAQPTTSAVQHWNHDARELDGPHGYAVINDGLTGKTDGILRRCRERDVCPKIVAIEGGNEYWNKASALNETDAEGHDLDLARLAPELRIYFLSSIQHSALRGDRPQPVETCQGLTNPLYPGVAFRALIADLDDWVAKGMAPPPSHIPTRRDGTLVPPEAVRFPAIPGVPFSPSSLGGVSAIDFSQVPFAEIPGKRYAALAPQVDADGNDMAGVRLPFLAVPLGAHTGWQLLDPEFGGPDLCGQNGQFIPFARTKAERLAAGDPRLSLEERYGTLDAYRTRLRQAIDALVGQRLLLAEDSQSLLDEGVALATAAGLGH
jgi:hypothetical protein